MPYGKLARKNENLTPFWHIGTQARWHAHHANTQARWHVDHIGTQARMARDLANSFCIYSKDIICYFDQDMGVPRLRKEKSLG